MRTRYMTLCATFAVAMIAAGAGCGGSSSSGETPPPAKTFKLTVTKPGNGTGGVKGGGIDCGSTCEASIADGTTVTLTATYTTTDGSSFGGWGGACSGTIRTCQVKVAADTAVTAIFLGRQLTLATAGHGGGSIGISGADGLNCGVGCTAFTNGAKVTLSAAATPDSRFTGWSGACTAASGSCEVTMDDKKSVTATFAYNGKVDGQPCYLPSEFAWSSSGKLAEPANGYVSLKDFSSTVYNGKRLVYASNVIANTTKKPPYSGTTMSFAVDDWSAMKDATQDTFDYGVAPTLFQFAPNDGRDPVWVLAYQWPVNKDAAGKTVNNGTFAYRTTTTPDVPASWSEEKALYTFSISDSDTNVIDQTLICDSTNCYLYFAGDNGKIYRSSMPIADFLKAGKTFPQAETILTAAKFDMFEAVQVYTVKGTNQYLMIVECIGAAGRYFRALTTTSLAGTWVPLTTSESKPFAGKSNVDFGGGVGLGGGWTDDISHGDLVRDNPDQTFTVDACKLELLYQGVAQDKRGGAYDLIPWRPGLLTQSARVADPQ